MLPYQAWVTLATALNYSIWQKNGDRPVFDKKE
jgi:tryptophan-rich sensory protein